MITLHILQLLEDNGFGTIAKTGNEANADLFFEKLPHDRNGIYITANGVSQLRGKRQSQSFNLYARGTNDLDGAAKLESIANFFEGLYGTTCTLPVVPELSETVYTSVVIEAITSVASVGVDDNDRVIYTLAGLVIYNK